MAGVAKVTLIGNLGRDPETRYTPSGTMNVQFSIAVSRRWNDQGGQLQERTTWFRVTAWGRLAETLDRLTQSGALVKGKQVYVLGTVEQREYQDQQGATRTSLDVNADEVQLLGSRQDSEAPAGRTSGGGRSEGSEQPYNDIDDVPF
jgi:single-strand DNA-binding protein